MASKEVWSTTPDIIVSKKTDDTLQPISGPSTSTTRAGPKSWKRRVARAKEEKTFAHVDDLLMSDSEDELQDSRSATDNLNETENFANTEDDETSEYSDEFEIDDLGFGSNLLNQPPGTQGKFQHSTGVRSECSICSQILPTTRLTAHESLPHPVPCTYEGCGKKFILEKTLQRHVRKAHIPKAPTPTLISTQLSQNEEVSVAEDAVVSNRSQDVTNSATSIQDVSATITNAKADGKQNTEKDADECYNLEEPIVPTEHVIDSSSPDDSQVLDPCDEIKGDGGALVNSPPRHLEETIHPDGEIGLLPQGNVDIQANELADKTHSTQELVSPNSEGVDIEKVNETEGEKFQVDSKDVGSEQVEEEASQFEEPPGPYICKFCKEEYKSWGTLTRHFITPHLFKCEFCDLVFNRKSTLEDHINMLHDLVGLIDSTQCGMCGETFSRSSTLARHIAAPHNFPCRKCEKKFQSKASLSKHNIVCPNKHLVIEEEPLKTPKVKKRKGKKSSGSPAKRMKKLKTAKVIEDESSDSETEMDTNENNVVHRETSKSCSIISSIEEVESSDDEMNLSQRLEKSKKIKSKTDQEFFEGTKEDKEEPKVKKPKMTHTCELCNQTISGGKASFRNHQSKDHKFACDLCERRYIMKSRLNDHKKTTHTDEMYEFECKFCLFKVFSGTKISMTLVKNKIQKHKALTHSFSCDECDLKFVSGERLSFHKSNNHGTEFKTDFHCKLCDKIFENKDEVKKTMEFLDHNETSHNFSCDFCTLSFITSNALKKHSEDVHVNETHCYKCKIEFSQDELHKHVKVPHPFDCDECDFHFITEERLRYHCMNLHDKEDTLKTVCNDCNNNIEEIEDFLNHIEMRHNEECVHCSLSFIDEAGLNLHVESQHPKKEFVCCQCGQNFEDAELEYEKHIDIEHTFKCRFCDKIFIKKSGRVKHVSKEHGDLKFSCKWCGKSFKNSFEDFESHEEEKHDIGCRYCEKRFTDKTSLINHTTSCHIDKNFFCKFCSQDFGQDFDKCLKHEDMNHEFKCENCDKCFIEKSIHDKHSLDVHGVSVGLDLKCGQCQERFSNTGAFREHFKVPHKIFCSLCDLKFPSQNKLNEHISKAHQKSTKAEKLVCKLCNKKFDSKENAEFEEHKNMKHKYKCDNCDMMFVKSGRLRDHIDETHGHSKSIDNKFTCKLCRTICNKKNDMKLSKEAYKMHCSLPHKFPCRNCDLRFASKSRLDIHMQASHTEISANECPICGSRFSDLHKLRDHKNEPHMYNCKDGKCKKRFVTESSLEKHLQRKHKEFAQATFKDGQVLFRCKMCSYIFESNLALQSHQYVKHSYNCHLCDNSYIKKDDLTRHLLKIHRVEKIPQAGFRCKLCKLETKKMIEIRKHLSLPHKYQCTFCQLMYTNKNQLDVHMEENHMDQVMMAMEGGDHIEDDEAPNKQPHLARLGVNVLLWAGSKQVVKHLHKVMEGQTSSTRHKLFLNKQEREECCRSEDSKLFTLSGSRFFNLPTPTDQALIEVCSETYKTGQPILHGITKDKFTFEYVTCVLIPEMWILYFRKLKGLTSGEAEKKFVEKLEPERTLDAWKDFEEAITKWKNELNQKSETTDNREVKLKEQRKNGSDCGSFKPSDDVKLNCDAGEKDSKCAENPFQSTAEDLDGKLTTHIQKLSGPRLHKSEDPRLEKTGDPRLSKTGDPRLKKRAGQHDQKSENGENNSQEPMNTNPAKVDHTSQQLDIENNLGDIHYGQENENIQETENAVQTSVDTAPEESKEEVMKIDAEELDTIAQFLENSS